MFHNANLIADKFIMSPKNIGKNRQRRSIDTPAYLDMPIEFSTNYNSAMFCFTDAYKMVNYTLIMKPNTCEKRRCFEYEQINQETKEVYFNFKLSKFFKDNILTNDCIDILIFNNF